MPGRDVSVVIGGVPPCEVRGSVVDETSSPIVDALVTLNPVDGVRMSDRSPEVTTGDDGCFVLRAVESTKFHMLIAKTEHGATRRAVDCSRGGDVDLGQIVLPTAPSIRGRVSHPDASAFGGIRHMFPKLQVGVAPLDVPNAATTLAHAVTGYWGKQVDADGGFELRGISEGTYLLFAAEAGMSGPWTGTVAQVRGQNLSGIDLDLPRRRPWRCDLQVVAGLTMPEASSEVLAIAVLSDWFARGPVDASGEAELLVGAGPFLVGVRLGNAIRWIARSDGQQTSERIEMPDGSLTIEGLDIGQAGDLVMSEVRLTYVAGQLPAEHLPLRVPCGPLGVNAIGQVLVEHLPPGEYRIDILAPNWGRRELDFRIVSGEKAVRAWFMFR
jgi:hypothetical protein